MNAWLTLASLVVVIAVLVLAAVVGDRAATAAVSRPSTAGRRRWTQAGSGTGGATSQLDAVLRAKIDELEKLGVTPDDVVKYIWRMRQAAPDQLRSVSAGDLSSWSRTSTSSDQRLVTDRTLLVRHFVRNRTVSCNDGSPAGYLLLWCYIPLRNLDLFYAWMLFLGLSMSLRTA